jgi:hypothetical protein
MAWRLTTLDPYPWQRDVFRSQPAFERLVPPGLPIGSFNAGIPGYFSHRTIINLDGLVNHSVYPYYKARRFDAYLRERGIEYISDEEASLDRARRFTTGPLAVRVLDRAPLTRWWSGDRYLWRITTEPGVSPAQ